MAVIIVSTVIATIGIIAVILAVYLFVRSRRGVTPPPAVEIAPGNIEVLAEYVRAQKEQGEREMEARELKRAEQKQKLDNFKQTREQLREKLRVQIDAKDWRPLESIIKSADKGGTGIYILYNSTKNKYYVGQAKQLYKRVRDHFAVEDIARDYIAGDEIRVKFLTANELDSDYRLDHIEKTGIEIFDAGKTGYNRTTGNVN